MSHTQSKDWRSELKEWLRENPKTEPTELRDLRAQFLQRFPKERLPELTIEQYAQGLGSKDTFCYWLEVKTRKLGYIGGANASKFGVWKSRRENRWRWVKRWQTAEETFAQFKQGFIELIHATENGHYDQLDDIRSRYVGSGNHMVPIKVLSLYFPDQFLPIFSDSHLRNYMGIFGLTPPDGAIAGNRQLMQALQNLPDFQGFDTLQIGNFLYDRLAPPRKEDEEGSKISIVKAPRRPKGKALRGVQDADFATGMEAHPELRSEEETESSEITATRVEIRPVVSEPKDWTISTLREKWERSQIDLQPSYQREYVWRLKPELPSRLIESILLQIPVPPIYLGKLPNNKLEVIDGQQRLTTLIMFIQNQFPLQRLAKLKHLNGKTYSSLPAEYQDKLLDASIRSIVIDAGENQDLRYEVFERLNRGAMSLNEQEIRTCVNRGPFVDLLGELEASQEWRKVKGTEKPEPRFAEREMILRFFALAARIDHYTGNLRRFLNDYMGDPVPNDPAQINGLRETFLQTMKNVYLVFGENSGRIFTLGTEKHQSPEGRWEPKFSVSALDIQAGALVGQSSNQVRKFAEKIQAAYVLYLLGNPRIGIAITRRPAEKDATKLRWNGFKVEVQKILAGHESEYAIGGDTDPLKDAKLLMRIGLFLAGGARAGVALEKHLKMLCERHQSPIPYDSDKGISHVNNLLKQNNVYDQAHFLQVQWMGNIRNRCDHPTDSPPTKEEIAELVAKVEEMMGSFPV